MRALFLFLIAGVVVLGSLLVGCGGDEEQQQIQSDQEQSGQTGQTEQSSSTATAERSTTEERAQQSQESAEQDAEQQIQEEAEAEVDARDVDPLFAEASAAFEAWVAELETFEMEIDVDINLGGLSTQLSTSVVARLQPFMALTTIDASSLFEMASGLADDEQADLDEPLLMRVLLSDDTAYLSMPQIDGWIDLSDQFEETLSSLTAMLGANPEDLTDPSQFGQTLGCIEAVGGSISEGEHGGQAVWFLECQIDVDGLNAAASEQLRAYGIDVADAGIETMLLRLAVSQSSGAPLLVESVATLRDAFGLGGGESEDSDEDAPEFYVSSVSNLISWNEPVEFPTPEPLVDSALLGDFAATDSDESPGSFGSDDEPPELPTVEQLLEEVAIWVATADELDMQFLAQAVIDGEPRVASTSVRGSRSQGAFETVVNIDDGSTFRLLWNRDGIWTSDAEEDGEPIWAPSSPALLGFAGLTVDQFLANPDRLNLNPLHSLLNISWLTRTVEGGRPAMYELVIESGPLTPGDPQFDHVVEILKSGTAELLAESVVIESIEYYSTVLTIVGERGELTSQVTTAEFQTGAGRVELVASLTLISNGTIEFSRPTE